jgi:hypothetical protein
VTLAEFHPAPPLRKQSGTTKDKVVAAKSAETRRPFPRWPVKEGISFETLLDFVKSGEQTTDHKKDVNGWFPETLYVVDSTGLWVSEQHRKKTNGEIPVTKGTVNRKLAPTEDLAMKAIERIKEETEPQFRRLREVVLESAGFPLLAFYGDYTGCNHKNWKNEHSIPLFTTAANVQCQHTFPWPTYQTVKDSRQTATKWETIQKKWNEQYYPWEDKISKVFWRGSITGLMDNKGLRSLRWQMLKQVKDLSTSNTSSAAVFDVGATRLPRRWEYLNLNLNEVGGIVNGISPMSEFMRYKAVLDIDGNSWSSRFGALLCYNSVVLKVEAMYVDYFYFKESDPLLPWKHYVPVEANLSDLVEQAAYVVDPANDDQMRKIVAKANAWCQRNMVESVLVKDVLNIWQKYIQKLDQGNSDWQKIWHKARKDIFASQLNMIHLQS